MITKLFPTQCNVYAKGPVGENVMHVAMLLNTPSTLAICRRARGVVLCCAVLCCAVLRCVSQEGQGGRGTGAS
jgi:hypothetical protein